MTVFGIDISHHNAGIDLRRVEEESNVVFVMAKCTEGQGYQDPQFAEFKGQVEDTNLLFAAYHYIRGDSAIVEQVNNVQRAVKDSGVPIILDIERTNGYPQPTMRDVKEFTASARARGLVVSNLLYLPEWFWPEIGHPDTGGWDLWQSDYGVNGGPYPGDASSRWIAMGRQASILQFTSAGRVPGYAGNLDINAFRGTREELAQKGWFYDYKEHEVATKTEIQQWVATTPIKIDDDGTTWPLQQVLRDLRRRVGAIDTPSAEEVASAVVEAIPQGVELTRSDVKEAVTAVFREKFGA